MRKLLYLLPLLLFFFAAPAQASCTGSSPNWTTTPDSSSVQTCINNAASSGDTITILQGSATWSSQVTLSGKNITIVGSTACVYGCAPGSGGFSGKGVVSTSGTAVTWVSGTAFNTGWTGDMVINGTVYVLASVNSGTSATLATSAGTQSSVSYIVPIIFSDNNHTCSSVGTCITLSVDQAFKPTPTPTNFVNVSGITWIIDFFSSHGLISFCASGCTHNTSPAYRFHHNHIVGPASDPSSDSRAVEMDVAFGLIDHNYWEDLNVVGSCSGGSNNCAMIPLVIGGDFPSIGYWNWQQPSALGTNSETIIEDNSVTSSALNLEGFGDCYFGAQIAQRFNMIINLAGLNCHGTDSGGFRSAVAVETLGNYISMLSSLDTLNKLSNSRGGEYLLIGNTYAGTATPTGTDLQFQRYNGQNTTASGWGLALLNSGVNWTPKTVGSSSNYLNPPAATWTASHSYAALAQVVSGGNNYLNTGGSCTSGGSGPTGTTFGGTSSDGGCTWTYLAAGSGTPPGTTGTNAGFLSTDNETTCSSGANCTRYFDNAGGTYPFRDQPCLGHGQVVLGCYAAVNVNAPSGGDFGTDAGYSSNVVLANRDYFNYVSSGFNGTVGTGSGTLAAIPSTCTTGVGYWATDQGSWNTSGNGFGQGVLYKCTSTNTWTAFYTPYTYPDPLNVGGGGVVLSPSSESYGLFNVGASSSPVTFTLTNNSGTTCTSISPTDTDSTEFPITNSGAGSCAAAGGSLAAGASCTFTVTFSPTSAGARTPTLSVTYSGGDGASPQTAALSGTGVSATAPAPAMMARALFPTNN